MTDTDRIAQMAREAHDIAVAELPKHGPEAFTRLKNQAFARLVAEDCAKVVDSADTPDGWSNSHISDAIRARYSKEG